MKRIQTIIGIILMCLVLLMGALLAKNSKEHNIAEYKERLTSMSELRYTSISDKLFDYETIVIAVKQLFMSSDHVTRLEFKTFVEPILDRNAEIQAIEWIPEVARDERMMYTENAFLEGYSDFEIKSLVDGELMVSPEMNTYYPVYYIEPFEGNEAVLGLDLGSNASRMNSLINAKAWDNMVISEPIRLVQDPDGGLGFLMIYAIQDENIPNGFVLIVYRFNDFIYESLLAHESIGLNLMVLDITDGDYHTVYKSDNHLELDMMLDDNYFQAFPMEVGGRDWSFVFMPSIAHMDTYLPKTEDGIWIGTFALMLLIGIYLWISIKNEQRLVERIDAQVHEIDEQNIQLQMALEGAGQALWDWNLETNRTKMGKNWVNLIGYCSEELNDMEDPWPHIIHPIDYQRVQDILQRTIDGTESYYHAEYRMVKKDGSVGWFYDEGRLFEKDTKGKPTRFAGTVHDVTEIVELRDKLKTRAVTDQLTGLYNRRYLFEQLAKFFALYQRHEQQYCLVIMDIDHFKKVNDTYGHVTGDFVLREFAQFIKTRLRHTDLVARYGGEEFVAVLHEVSLDEAEQLVNDIRKAIDKRKLTFENNLLHHTFSAGVVSFNEVDSIDEVVSLADERLYAAKETGRNRVVAD